MHKWRGFLISAMLLNIILIGSIVPFSIFQSRHISPTQFISVSLHTSGPTLDWSLLWGGSEGDWGYGVAVDSAGNVVMGGYTDNYGPGTVNLFVAKYNNTGFLLWNKTWGRIGWVVEGYSVAVDNNNNIYVAGYHSTQGGSALLVKYNATGDQEWNQTWGGENSDIGKCVAVDLNGNPFVVGWTESFGAGYRDAFIVKYDQCGTQLWNATWGWFSAEEGNAVVVDKTGSAYLVGYTNHSKIQGYDAFIVKYNETGIEQWNRTFSAGGNDVAVDENGYIYLTGGASAVKYSSEGNLVGRWEWDQTTHSRNWAWNTNTFGSDVMEGGVFVAGEASSSVGTGAYCGKYDVEGKLLGELVWDGNEYEISRGIAVDRNGCVYCVGVTKSYGMGMEDAFLLKYSQFPNITVWIKDPWDGIELFDPPAFSIEVAGANVSTMWYTVDQGLTNLTFTNPTGFIDEGAWAAMPLGEVIIRFYANNTDGLETYSELTITKVLNVGLITWNLIFIGGGIFGLCLVIFFIYRGKKLVGSPK